MPAGPFLQRRIGVIGVGTAAPASRRNSRTGGKKPGMIRKQGIRSFAETIRLDLVSRSYPDEHFFYLSR